MTPKNIFLLAAVLLISLAAGIAVYMNFLVVPPPVVVTYQPVATSTQPAQTPGSEQEPVPPLSIEVRMQAYTTAYTYLDNTPPGSAIIAFRKSDGFPTLHDLAGGTGTYQDPVTLAVGHVRDARGDTPDFAPGVKFYIPNLRKYFIVEDTCGDGDRPQDIPCHHLTEEATSAGATVWLDLWIGGDEATSEDAADSCASAVTDAYLVIQKPAANYSVVPGPVLQGSVCGKQFGNTVVKQ